MGAAGMTDRSSSPHRVANRTPQHLVRKVVHLRWKQRLGPIAIGAKLAMPASTVHAVLVRCRLNRLHHVDKRTGEVIRRYEHDKPGAMIHVDVKKLGNIPDGGGWRYVGRQEGKKNRAMTPAKTRSNHRNPLIGTAYVHTVVDDHSRVAYAEIHDDETAATAATQRDRALSVVNFAGKWRRSAIASRLLASMPRPRAGESPSLFWRPLPDPRTACPADRPRPQNQPARQPSPMMS
jgi:hypothetical protein